MKCESDVPNPVIKEKDHSRIVDSQEKGLNDAPSPTHLLPLHDDGLRQRVVAALLVGEALQIIQLSLELEDEILLFLPLSLQTLPLLSVALTARITHTHTHRQSECTVTQRGAMLYQRGRPPCGRLQTHQILLAGSMKQEGHNTHSLIRV